MRIFLPPNIPAEKIEIRYALYGVFGAYGGFVESRIDSASVEIPLAVDGKSANEIKAFAWAPGCRVATFDIKVDGLDLQKVYSCDPAPNVLLRGQIREAELLHRAGIEVSVGYLAHWACEFFGFNDCMVPGFSVGATAVDSGGTFELELPDFYSDPACTGPALSSTFQLWLREVKTKNPVARLIPESNTLRTPGGELESASAYPNPTTFVANKPR